jgi:hypothetical protein
MAVVRSIGRNVYRFAGADYSRMGKAVNPGDQIRFFLNLLAMEEIVSPAFTR